MPLWQRLAKIPRTLRQPNAVLLTTRELLCTAGGCRFSCMVWVWYTTGVTTNITKQPRARCHIGSLVQARSLLLATRSTPQAAPRGKA